MTIRNNRLSRIISQMPSGVSLSELAEAFNDDYSTKKLIEKWIDGEKDHMAWEAQYLNYIDKLDYENFLTAMM